MPAYAIGPRSLLERVTARLLLMSGDAAKAGERYRLALDLFAVAEDIMHQNLRRRFPNASPAETEARFVAWLHQRPCAEHGDAVGRPRPWPR